MGQTMADLDLAKPRETLCQSRSLRPSFTVTARQPAPILAMILAGLDERLDGAAGDFNFSRSGDQMLFKRAKTELNDNAPQPPLTSDPASVVGRDAEITGTFSTAGDVHVEGTVRGTVKARRCVVEADGLVEGQIAAEEIVVRGRVQGPLRAYHVHLQAGARVEGDIINDGIVIDDGAELTGAVWRSDDPLAETAAAARPPLRPAADATRIFDGALWPDTDAHSLRPLTAIRPR